MFKAYLEIGWEHICDIHAYDHLLFVVIISMGIAMKDWFKLLKLLSAFTIGHSISLIYAVWYPIGISVEWIEHLIIASIGLSIVLKWYRKDKIIEHWGLILFFGLIHGMGFSNYLKALFGKSGAVWEALLAFNIGIELGQITIVLIFLAVQWFLLRIINPRPRSIELTQLILVSLAFLYILLLS